MVMGNGNVSGQGIGSRGRVTGEERLHDYGLYYSIIKIDKYLKDQKNLLWERKQLSVSSLKLPYIRVYLLFLRHERPVPTFIKCYPSPETVSVCIIRQECERHYS